VVDLKSPFGLLAIWFNVNGFRANIFCQNGGAFLVKTTIWSGQDDPLRRVKSEINQ
jgi:hypothetical protein